MPPYLLWFMQWLRTLLFPTPRLYLPGAHTVHTVRRVTTHRPRAHCLTLPPSVRLPPFHEYRCTMPYCSLHTYHLQPATRTTCFPFFGFPITALAAHAFAYAGSFAAARAFIRSLVRLLSRCHCRATPRSVLYCAGSFEKLKTLLRFGLSAITFTATTYHGSRFGSFNLPDCWILVLGRKQLSFLTSILPSRHAATAPPLPVTHHYPRLLSKRKSTVTPPRTCLPLYRQKRRTSLTRIT